MHHLQPPTHAVFTYGRATDVGVKGYNSINVLIVIIFVVLVILVDGMKIVLFAGQFFCYGNYC